MASLLRRFRNSTTLLSVMSETARASITALLARCRAGEPDALGCLLPLVYDELRQVARRQIRREPRANTLSATALVHEVYLRLVQQRRIEAGDRDSFLAIAAQTMRRVLVDHARRRQRLKRGGDLKVSRSAIREPALLTEPQVNEMLVLESVLGRLADLDELAARIVECRIFAGLTVEETAVALGTPVRTVQRTWATARAWLRKEMAA